LLTAKARDIIIPSDLEGQLCALFAKQKIAQKHAKAWASAGKSRAESSQLNQEYRIIIDGLQVNY